mmetsp:Transcript_31774/g.51461  ORF Transcript_31774/g.51461 Transcript_31774/m.51461 type:complete len:103 (-) Transcript_31774:334-642(-)
MISTSSRTQDSLSHFFLPLSSMVAVKSKVFKNLEDAAEFAKIGRYYAAESMLMLDDKGQYNSEITPSYGNDTLQDFFENSIKYGLKGQELGDQAVFGINKKD